MEELLKKKSSSNSNSTKPSDKTILYWSLGIGAVVLIGLVLILIIKSKKNKKH